MLINKDSRKKNIKETKKIFLNLQKLKKLINSLIFKENRENQKYLII